MILWHQLDTQGKREAVRELVQVRKLTFTQAADILGISNSAIAGVVGRSKDTDNPILARDTSAKPKAPKKDPTYRPGDNTRAKAIQRKLKDPNRKPRRAGFNVMPAIFAEMASAQPPAEEAWRALPGSHPVSLEQHHNGCRWPIGEDSPFLFCNEETLEGSPYCPAHTAMGTRPLTRNERKLAKVPRAKGAVASTAWE